MASRRPSSVSSFSAHATGARDTLRLLVLLTVLLVILFKPPQAEKDLLPTVVAHNGQTAPDNQSASEAATR